MKVPHASFNNGKCWLGGSGKRRAVSAAEAGMISSVPGMRSAVLRLGSGEPIGSGVRAGNSKLDPSLFFVPARDQFLYGKWMLVERK